MEDEVYSWAQGWAARRFPMFHAQTMKASRSFHVMVSDGALRAQLKAIDESIHAVLANDIK